MDSLVDIDIEAIECKTIPTGVCYQVVYYSANVVKSNPELKWILTNSSYCRPFGVTNLLNSESSGTFYYTIIPELNHGYNNSATFNTFPETAICINYENIINLSASDQENDSLVYSLYSTFEYQFIFNSLEDLELVVSDICKLDSVQIEFELYGDCQLDVGNVISINSDGMNDVLFFENLDLHPVNKLIIYNRWGNQVYETDNYDNTWTGIKENGTELTEGTYYYLLTSEYTRSTGFFNLVR